MANKSVFCIVTTRDQADQIVERLKAENFSNNDISALFANQDTTHDFAHEKHTKAPEGAITGVGTGGVLGGALGWIAGIGALAIPGVGPFIAAGPIMAALSGAAIGAAVGGIAGALIGMGIPHEDARFFERGVREGGTLVTVVAARREAEARDVLKAGGASLGALRPSAAPRIGHHTASAVPVDHGLVPGVPGASASWPGPERRAHRPGRRRSDT